jgi:hypothetical protein
MISTGETPDSSTRVLWQSYQQSHLVANQDNLGEGNDLVYEVSLSYFVE